MFMKKVNTATELTAHIVLCGVGISYIPYNDEPDPSVCPFISKTLPIYTIPQNPTLSPLAYVHKLTKKYGESNKLCIFIPGQAFDTTGTRHGRGHGWYDRFLSKVPHQWLRIGMVSIAHFHTEKIFRAMHDQPVDVVITFDSLKKEWSAHKTHARNIHF